MSKKLPPNASSFNGEYGQLCVIGDLLRILIEELREEREERIVVGKIEAQQRAKVIRAAERRKRGGRDDPPDGGVPAKVR